MAFLDNSGDIILDAVLTDAGRQRLARGQFKIVKFALGDEEINYSLYNAEHAQGSAFYDLEIMQTPILEAFTNNTSLMKSKLVTINENNILYMPTFKLNNNANNSTRTAINLGFDGYIVTADYNTSTNGNTTPGVPNSGVLLGDPGSSYIAGSDTIGISVDTGIDVDTASTGLSVADPMPANLLETAFLVRVDDRMLRLTTYTGPRATTTPMVEVRPQFVDDDRIATYFFALGDSNIGGDRGMVVGATENFRRRGSISPTMTTEQIASVQEREAFTGPLGTVLRILPKAAPAVRNSSSLFDKMGTSAAGPLNLFEKTDGSMTSIGAHKFIDTTINVVGVTTGQSIDIPIRIVKKT